MGVELANRRDLDRGAGEEKLVGEIELVPRDVALYDREAERARELNDAVARDAGKDVPPGPASR